MAESLCFGAATIVNAIASGRGAAFGIGLSTKASVELNDSGEIDATIIDNPKEDTSLMKAAVGRVFSFFGVRYGAVVETESNIPIARGLKSSSVAANAVVLAAVAAVREKEPLLRQPSDLQIIKMGVDAAVEAKVTVTGAFDDAAASYFGGYVVSDNTRNRIIKSGRMKPLKVILFVPEKKMYTREVDAEYLKLFSKEVMLAWDAARRGKIFSAMTLNGLIYSIALHQDPNIALAALEAGALSAGLCGKGPTVAALVEGNSKKIRDAWSVFDGELIETETNNKKARLLR